MPLSLIPKTPEVVAIYERQHELEQTIMSLVDHHQGLKETDLWLMTMSAMHDGTDCPAPALIAGTIHRLIRQGSLVGIDYEYGTHANTMILPAGTATAVLVPIHVIDTRTGLQSAG